MSSCFITCEGIEGCGKSTQLHRLATFLTSKGYSVLTTREPGATRIGDQIRTLLLDPHHTTMHPLTELFLYAASRIQHVEEIIMPALQKKKVVLCDRFSDSTRAY